MICVLFNLFTNALYAILAAGKGGLAVSLARQGGRPQLTVLDTGSGIPADVLPRIFETFFTTKRAHGAGLGLAFCQRVIDSFGARLDCESVKGEYTAFHMRFPTLESCGQAARRNDLSVTS